MTKIFDSEHLDNDKPYILGMLRLYEMELLRAQSSEHLPVTDEQLLLNASSRTWLPRTLSWMLNHNLADAEDLQILTQTLNQGNPDGINAQRWETVKDAIHDTAAIVEAIRVSYLAGKRKREN